jgi:hypothetical protein
MIACEYEAIENNKHISQEKKLREKEIDHIISWIIKNGINDNRVYFLLRTIIKIALLV